MASSVALLAAHYRWPLPPGCTFRPLQAAKAFPAEGVESVMAQYFAPIDPYSDPRVTHEWAMLNGRRYHYVHGLPKGDPKATILLLHGFPDLWYGWRYIIPSCLAQGLRVICPDMLGYGGSDMPRVPPEPISVYGFKRASDDLASLLAALKVPRAIICGHDWGAMIAYRFAAYFPSLTSHLITLCVPFAPPVKTHIPLTELVEKKMPNFKYQLALIDPQTEKDLTSKEAIKGFLRGMIRAPGEGGRFNVATDIVRTVSFENAGTGAARARSRLLSERDLDYYAEQYANKGWHGPLSWYKTREVNDEEGKEIADADLSGLPSLFIVATKDTTMTPRMVVAHKRYLPKASVVEVDSSHWVMVERNVDVNAAMKDWIDSHVFGQGKSKI